MLSSIMIIISIRIRITICGYNFVQRKESPATTITATILKFAFYNLRIISAIHVFLNIYIYINLNFYFEFKLLAPT